MFYDKVGMFIVVFEEPFLIKYIIVYKKLNMEIQKTNIKINPIIGIENNISYPKYPHIDIGLYSSGIFFCSSISILPSISL